MPSKQKGDEMRRQGRTRKAPPIKHTVRFYPGEDDDLIDGLDELAAQPGKTINQIFKDALRQLLRGAGLDEPATQVEAAINLAEIRQVVEAGVESALARFDGQIRASSPIADEDYEAEAWLDGLGTELVLDDEGH